MLDSCPQLKHTERLYEEEKKNLHVKVWTREGEREGGRERWLHG